jgi:hypothetical protein
MSTAAKRDWRRELLNYLVVLSHGLRDRHYSEAAIGGVATRLVVSAEARIASRT